MCTERIVSWPLAASSPSFRCLSSLPICTRPWICALNEEPVCEPDERSRWELDPYSISSNVFFSASGRSLNLVAFTKGGGPVGVPI